MSKSHKGEFHQAQRGKRVAFSEMYKDVAPEDIVLQDESGMDIKGNMAQKIWFRNDVPLSDWSSTTRTKRVNFSACVTWDGIVVKVLEPGKTFKGENWADYIEECGRFLEKKSHPVKTLFIDNHRMHFCPDAREAVANTGMQYSLLNFPAYSPDLQPLENCWPA